MHASVECTFTPTKQCPKHTTTIITGEEPPIWNHALSQEAPLRRLDTTFLWNRLARSLHGRTCHSGELNHALSQVGGQVGGPTQSQLSRPTSSGHHISMEHGLRRKHLQLNSDTDASSKTQKYKEKEKEETFFKEKTKMEKKTKRKMENMTAKSTSNGPLLTFFLCLPKPNNQIFTKENRPFYNRNFSTIFLRVLAFARTTGKRKRR